MNWKSIEEIPEENKDIIVWIKNGYRNYGYAVIREENWVTVLKYDPKRGFFNKDFLYPKDGLKDAKWIYLQSDDEK